MVVAFIGHRKIKNSLSLKRHLKEIIENLIINDKADVFLFGSKSKFNDMCYEVVTELKKLHPHIKRVYIRAEFEFIDKLYETYLLSLYEETQFPIMVHGAGINSYIKRNEVMIDMCDLAVVYFDESYLPESGKYQSKSGTKLSVEYAKRKNKAILNVFVKGQ